MQMDVKEALQRLEAELRELLPDLATTQPELIRTMAAANLAGKYEREGIAAYVPCPVCGEVLQVGRVELSDGKGSVWIGCKNKCTTQVLDYGDYGL